jgi:hypothetical protein
VTWSVGKALQTRGKNLFLAADRANSSMATANFTGEDWIFERRDWGRKFSFARADANRAEFLLPEKEIGAWASGKVATRQGKSSKNRSGLYRPIHDKDEFRVVELKPGGQNEELRGVLHHFTVEFVSANEELFEHNAYTPEEKKYTQRFALSTDDYVTPMKYTALSYTWGKPDPSTDTTIDCEGHKLKITGSLATALKQFRKTDHSILLWIDQICINQQDKKEKVQQIPLMSSIYQFAINTAIWLGEADSGSTSAMLLLEDVDARLQFNQAIDISPDDFEEHQLPGKTSEKWQHLMNLLARQWFSRLWIIQEVVLSRDPWVLCGDYNAHWSTIDNGCNTLATSGISNWLYRNFSAFDSLGTKLNGRGDICKSIVDLSLEKSAHDGGPKPPLRTLLISTRDAEATDNRDKVYGLLGICARVDLASVDISYDDDWTVPKLYHDMTVKFLRSNVGLEWSMLSVDHESSDLPSWVPDWRLPRKTSSLGYSSFMRNVYCASGEQFIKKPVGYKFTISGQENAELRTQGTLVDKLCFLGDQFSDPDISYVDPSISNQALLSAYNFVNSNLTHFSDSTQKSMFSTFWRTLVAGQDANGMDHCPESFAEIFSLLLDETSKKPPSEERSLPGQSYSKRQRLPKGRGRLELASLESRKAGETFQEIRKVFRRVLQNRRLGILGNGLLGLFPRHSQSGDIVCVIFSFAVPVLLRPVANMNGKFQLVGECYVHGIMRGEAVDSTKGHYDEIILV